MPSVARILDRALLMAIAFLLAAMVVDVAIQVFFRYVIQNPPDWTEELARYLFIWQIFLGASLAFGRGSNIVVDAVTMVLPVGPRKVLAIVANLLVLAFLGVLAWQGAAMTVLTATTTSTAMHLNMGIVYAALPTGALISILFVVLHLIELLRGGSTAKPDDSRALNVMVD